MTAACAGTRPESGRIAVRVGIPLRGGQLVRAAKERRQPVLFSANAFARTYPASHPRSGDFRSFAVPDLNQFDGLDAALDSAGFVAAVRYGDFRWSVESYVELAASFAWRWWASMDYCCEPQIANDHALRLLRLAATAGKYAECARVARRRGIAAPMPVIQGWRADEYLRCVEWMPIHRWPDIVGLGSMCRRHVHGADGILEIVDALDRVLPANVRFHLFGVKSAALAALAHHPRIVAVDSMAWDMRARGARRTSRTMDFRIECMDTWIQKQERQLEVSCRGAGVQRSLIDPQACGGVSDVESMLIESVALQWVTLLLSNEWEYASCVAQCRIDAMNAIAVLRSARSVDRALPRLDAIFEGLARQFEDRLARVGGL